MFFHYFFALLIDTIVIVFALKTPHTHTHTKKPGKKLVFQPRLKLSADLSLLTIWDIFRYSQKNMCLAQKYCWFLTTSLTLFFRSKDTLLFEMLNRNGGNFNFSAATKDRRLKNLSEDSIYQCIARPVYNLFG